MAALAKSFFLSFEMTCSPDGTQHGTPMCRSVFIYSYLLRFASEQSERVESLLGFVLFHQLFKIFFLLDGIQVRVATDRGVIIEAGLERLFERIDRFGELVQLRMGAGQVVLTGL